MTSFPKKLKDPRTCRVFVSSPFGGIEREREELVARYLPELTAMCQAKGVQLVVVDMRWGITEEAASDNQVVNICLREIDRSDIFLGIYGQRYGWHGKGDDSLQQNINLCVKRYPWLNGVRDRSVTEFEFMHGHLNKPGTLPAAFAFRAKEYDDEQLAAARKAGNPVLERKYSVETDTALTLLSGLKDRVRKTQAKCLAIHDNYKTPGEAATRLFEDLKRHMENVLLKDTVALTPRDAEMACHDAVMATRTSLYVGGQAYMKELDSALSKGGCGHVVVGPAGSGKAALVSNWLTAVRKKKTHELVYHFVGCSKDSADIGSILQRLTDELERAAGEVKKRKTLAEREEEGDGGHDLADLFQKLNVAIGKAARKKKVLLVIDGLTKVDKHSRTSKELFWLPTDLPAKVTMVLTCRDDNKEMIDLLKERGYGVTTILPLTEAQRKDFCVGLLKQSGKELSPAQLKKIIETKQTENAFFLKIVISELCAFGSFHELEEKITSLIKSKNVAELFEQFLVRLEQDYNGKKEKDKTLIQQVMCSLTLAKKGLTETEIRDMLNVASAAWSPIYFAIKDFILDYSGLLRLGFQELREAVMKRYMPTTDHRRQYIQPMILYFQKQRKSLPVTMDPESVVAGRVSQELPWLLRSLGDKDGLIEVLTDMAVFGRLFLDEEYELMELWRLTGRSGEQIARLYLQAIDQRKQRFLQEVTKDSVSHVIDMFVLSYLDALTYFLELSHYTGALENVLKTRIAALEKMSGQMNEERRQRMLSMIRVKLSYIHADHNHFTEASRLLEEVLAYRREQAEKAKGEDALVALKDLAGCYHAVGLVSSKKGDLEKAVDHYQKSMSIHAKLDRPIEYADSMNNLGVMLMKKGDFEKAAELCSKALKIYEVEYFGHLPPIIGVLTGNIAVCYRNLNRLDESEKMYKMAVDIAERALGRNHPNVAVALTNLGTLEVNRDMFAKAETYFLEALSIHRNCLTPENNADLFKLREKYVFTLVKCNKLEDAHKNFLQLYDQAVKTSLLSKAWVVVWCEMLTVLLTTGKAPLAAQIAVSLLTSGVTSDVIYTFLDRADKASKKAEKRPEELTVQFALEQNPASHILMAYQAQHVLIPAGRTAELLTLLDQSEAALKAGVDLFHAAQDWCRDKGQDEMAAAVLQHAAERFPDSLNVLSQIAGKLRDEEKFEEALPYALRMLNAKPDDPHVLLFAGEIILRNGDFSKAKETFNKVTTLCKPDSGEFQQAKGGLNIVDMMIKKKASISALKEKK